MSLGQSLLLQGQRTPVGEACGERLRQNLNATSNVSHGTSHDDCNLPLHWDLMQLPKLLPQNPRWQRDTYMSLEVCTCKHCSSGLHMWAIENEIIIIILIMTMNSMIPCSPGLSLMRQSILQMLQQTCHTSRVINQTSHIQKSQTATTNTNVSQPIRQQRRLTPAADSVQAPKCRCFSRQHHTRTLALLISMC